MKNVKLIALIESILEEKKMKTLKSLIESKGRKRVSEEFDDVTGDAVHDGLDQGDDIPDVSGVGSSGGGAGSTSAARKADGADSSQADISHLEEEDDAQFDLDSLLTGTRDGNDVVKTEGYDDEDDEELLESDESEDDEEEISEDTGLDAFFEDFDGELDLDDELATEAKRKKAVKKPLKKK